MRISVFFARVCGVARNPAVAMLCLGSLCLCPVLLAQSPGPGMPARSALRILEQATWGPTASSLADLQTYGFDVWFNNQVNAPYNYIPDQPLLTATGTNNNNVGPLQELFFSNALYGSYQVRQRLAFALSEIWVVSNVDLNSAAAFPPILRIFQGNALGNYETVMQQITINPAMGHYLDMANNNKGNPAKNTAANENYARELMQLFTLGLNKLNMDGSPVLDSNGLPVPTFTQSDVTNLAKMFTGWTYAPVAGTADKLNNPINYLAPMEFHDSEHDVTAKTFLGVSIPAGNSTYQDLNQALDIIFNQPTIAPFISTQLIQHLVTSNPSPAYVSRVSSVFVNNGGGVRGDLKAVVYQILTDPEARAGDTQATTSAPNFGHFREPVLFLANLLRGLNGQMNASSTLQGYANSMGQNLFNSPSVFSYFAPSYQANGITAPELGIYNTQTAVARTGIVNSAIFAGHLDANTTFNLTPFITAASSSGQAQFFSLVSELFFHNAMSTQVQSAMQQAMAAVTAPADKAKAGLYIALTSSEYQVIH